MAQTKIKAGLFEGIIGNGTDGYFLMSNGDGTMTWSSIIVNPTITSIAYPGSVTAADPAGGETITVTGTGFKTGATVTVGGTAAPAVSYVSETQITFTTPAKAAGDYDIVFTNTDTGSATYINGISYNGIPSWTTAAGSLGTFASEATISTITLQATEPDAGTITFNITNGALPTGLSLIGANIDGTTSLETADTLYTFTVTATDDESQATPRTFTITVKKEFKSVENFTINTYTGNGSARSIEGKIGTAASFNGSNSYIDMGSTIDNPLRAAGEFGVSFWFNADSYGTNPVIFKLLNDIYIYIFLNTSNQLECRVVNSSDVSSVITYSVSLNTWYHVVWTGDSTNGVTLYLNGSSVGNTSWNGTFLTYTNTNYKFNYLGYNGSNTGWYSGKIDQVRILNKALSSSEVTTLYGENNTSTTKSTTDIFDDGSGVALYEFEKGAIDTGGVSGYIGSGGIFNGSSSYIDLGSTINTAYVTPTGSFSASTWVNFSSVGSSIQQIINFSTNANIELALNGRSLGAGKIVLSLWKDSVYVDLISTTTISANTWYHITVTHNNGSWALYINGSSEATGTKTIVQPTTEPLVLGKRQNNTQYLNGKLDQVRIFNKALSSGEVTTLYGETYASSTKSTTDIFGDGSGVALYELEGNANDSGRFGRGAIDAGQSAIFNGSSRIDLPSLGSLSPSSDFTISCWVNAGNQGSGDNTIVTIWDNANIELRIDGSISNTVRVVYYSGSFLDANSSFTLTENEWTHLTVTYEVGTGFTFYKNLISSQLYSFTGTLGTIAGTNKIGQYAGDIVNGYFNGKIDQVRIYSSVLSASDIKALVSETNVPTTNLIAHYKLDGNANDSFGSYNGTWSGTEAYSDPAEFPTYDGTATNVTYGYDGTPTNVSFVGTSFQPDFVWLKNRDAVQQHGLFDSVRGADKWLHSETTQSEQTYGGGYGVLSFDSNGFSIGNGTAINASNEKIVAWCWKAGGTAVSNTDGTITSTVSANQNAGFSIVKYTGTGATATIGHGLDSIVELLIVKGLETTNDWAVLHKDNADGNFLQLNSSSAQSGSGGVFGSPTARPTDSVFTIGNTGETGTINKDYIAYCFHSVDSYQKIGSYSGGSSGSSNVITTGFKPRFLLVKRTNAAGDAWQMFDSIRGGGDTFDNYLQANETYAETSYSLREVNFSTNGFYWTNAESGTNISGGTYIYLAIA